MSRQIDKFKVCSKDLGRFDHEIAFKQYGQNGRRG